MEGLSWHVCIKMSRQLTGGGGMAEGRGSLHTICRGGHKLRSATWETYHVWFMLEDKQHTAEPAFIFPLFSHLQEAADIQFCSKHTAPTHTHIWLWDAQNMSACLIPTKVLVIHKISFNRKMTSCIMQNLHSDLLSCFLFQQWKQLFMLTLVWVTTFQLRLGEKQNVWPGLTAEFAALQGGNVFVSQQS